MGWKRFKVRVETAEEEAHISECEEEGYSPESVAETAIYEHSVLDGDHLTVTVTDQKTGEVIRYRTTAEVEKSFTPLEQLDEEEEA